MTSTTPHNAAWLKRAAKEVARQLKIQSTGTALRVRKSTKISVVPTSTRGWAATIGGLGKGQPEVEVWLDRYSGHTARKLYVCFSSRDAKQIKALSKKASKKLWPVCTITDSDVDHTKFYALKQRLPVDKFNAPIVENYDKRRYHFFGFYDPTRERSAKVSPLFVQRAVGFLADVARSQPKAREADSQTELYPRSENRKWVKAHLARERSGYLAAECKNRDDYRCRVCNFSFPEHYGHGLGTGFAEAHHILPLGKQSDRVKTELKDLITVCSNCHRMLHRMDGKKEDIDTLKKIVRKHR